MFLIEGNLDHLINVIIKKVLLLHSDGPNLQLNFLNCRYYFQNILVYDLRNSVLIFSRIST